MTAALPRPATRIRPRCRLHRCFELSARIQVDDPSWTLVHGYLQGWIEHAWLKRDGVVYDAVQNKTYTIEQYESEEQAQEVSAYDLKSACTLITRRGVYDFLPPRPETSPEAKALFLAARRGIRER